MTQKEEIALLKATIEELKARIEALEAPSLPMPSYPQPVYPWNPTWISSTTVGSAGAPEYIAYKVPAYGLGD